MVMTELPPELVEVIWLSPGTCAELALQRSGDGRGHDLGTGSRIKSHHLDGGIVHFGQRGNRQFDVGDNAHQQNGRHQQ